MQYATTDIDNGSQASPVLQRPPSFQRTSAESSLRGILLRNAQNRASLLCSILCTVLDRLHCHVPDPTERKAYQCYRFCVPMNFLGTPCSCMCYCIVELCQRMLHACLQYRPWWLCLLAHHRSGLVPCATISLYIYACDGMQSNASYRSAVCLTASRCCHVDVHITKCMACVQCLEGFIVNNLAASNFVATCYSAASSNIIYKRCVAKHGYLVLTRFHRTAGQLAHSALSEMYMREASGTCIL